jgi:hypothetical protein
LNHTKDGRPSFQPDINKRPQTANIVKYSFLSYFVTMSSDRNFDESNTRDDLMTITAASILYHSPGAIDLTPSTEGIEKEAFERTVFHFHGLKAKLEKPHVCRHGVFRAWKGLRI